MLDANLTRDWLDFQTFSTLHEKVRVEEVPNRVIDAVPNPILSVILVTYQHERYIKSAIESILMQETTFPFEIIIGDDESSDGTRGICHDYAIPYPDWIRLFLHRRANNISVLGRPTGIFQIAYSLFKARGKYLALTSGDDYWCGEKKLETQVSFLEDNPKSSYNYHDHMQLYEQSG